MSELLFGIGGLERGGTTLLLAKLSSHPDLSMVDDDEIFLNYDCYTLFKDKDSFNLFLDEIIEYHKLTEARGENFRYAYYDLIQEKRDSLLRQIKFPTFLVDVYPFLLDILAKKEKDDCKYIGFKTVNVFTNPYNFFALRSTFPTLKFIFITRNPVAHCAALMHYRGIDLSAALRLLNGFYNSQYLAIIKHKEFFSIKYEDLVDSPVVILDSISTYLGLHPFKYDDKVHYKGRESYLGNKIFKSKNDERLQSLSPDQFGQIDEATKELQRQLGYLSSPMEEYKSNLDYLKLEYKGKMSNLIKRNRMLYLIGKYIKENYFPNKNFWQHL